jgi:hypothetical protein
LSDFRVVLLPDAEFSDRELDWIEASHEWRLSDKEYGSVTWEVDRKPTQPDLEALRDFFELPGNSALNTLAELSPGELSAMHAQSSTTYHRTQVRNLWSTLDRLQEIRCDVVEVWAQVRRRVVAGGMR